VGADENSLSSRGGHALKAKFLSRFHFSNCLETEACSSSASLTRLRATQAGKRDVIKRILQHLVLWKESHEMKERCQTFVCCILPSLVERRIDQRTQSGRDIFSSK
jgi:hypothetical protein